MEGGESSTLTGTPHCELGSSIASPCSATPPGDTLGVVPQGRATTWKEAQRAYCFAHGTLRASIRDVLNDSCNENQDIPWELPRRGAFSTNAKEVANLLLQGTSQRLEGTQGPIKTSWMSRLVPTFFSATKKGDVEDGDEDDWIQEQDDAFQEEDNGRSRFSAAPDLAIPIVNLEMTKAAVVEMQPIIKQQSTITSPYLLVARSDWAQWVSSAANSRDSILSKVSVSDKEFLLQVLEETKQAKVIVRGSEDGNAHVIVLSPLAMMGGKSQEKNVSNMSNVESSPDAIPEYLQVHVALWDISRNEQSIESRIDEWSERVNDCTRKALLYKRKNQKSLAVHQLAKRKVIQKKIESSSTALIKLEQLKSAIETAQSNKILVDHLRTSAKLLKDLRLLTPLEEIDSIQDDWQSEFDKLQETQESLSALGVGSFDDDELLKELHYLTIENEDTPDNQHPPQLQDDDIKTLEARLAGLAGLGSSVSGMEGGPTSTIPLGNSGTFEAAS